MLWFFFTKFLLAVEILVWGIAPNTGIGVAGVEAIFLVLSGCWLKKGDRVALVPCGGGVGALPVDGSTCSVSVREAFSRGLRNMATHSREHVLPRKWFVCAQCHNVITKSWWVASGRSARARHLTRDTKPTREIVTELLD